MTYQPKDAFYLKAKREGYRSRAAYKLIELNRQFNLIRAGDRVVDLGAAPGGWLQVASRLAGPNGRVIGVDLQQIEPLPQGRVMVLQGDLHLEETQSKIRELLGGHADCVLSDMSPHLSGIRDADISRSLDLACLALNTATRLLRIGGNFLAKIFVGEEVKGFVVELKKNFRSVHATRPEASRKGSSEIYYCAKGFKGAPVAS